MLLRLFLILMMLLPTAAHAAPTILIYGDSLSAAYGIPRDKSWGNLLQLRLKETGYDHAVTNASISGETTSGGLSRIDKTLQDHHPALVILELGANDGLRGLPVADMRKNLSSIIEACQRSKAKVLLVGMRIPPNYGPRYTSDFLESYPQLAKQYRLPLLSFMLEGVAGKPAFIQDDGLHPTAEAQPRLLDNLWPMLKPMLGKPLSHAAR